MKLKLFILLLMGLFACQSQNKKMENPTLLSAEKSQWFGGREGVRGIHFNLSLKSEKEVTFDELVFDDHQKLKVKQTEKESVYYLTSSWTAKRPERTLSLDGKVETQKVQKLSDTAKLYYHYNDNAESHHFISVKFTHKKEEKPQMYP